MISLQGEFMSVNERFNVDYQGVVTCADCDGKILIIGESILGFTPLIYYTKKHLNFN